MTPHPLVHWKTTTSTTLRFPAFQNYCDNLYSPDNHKGLGVVTTVVDVYIEGTLAQSQKIPSAAMSFIIQGQVPLLLPPLHQHLSRYNLDSGYKDEPNKVYRRISITDLVDQRSYSLDSAESVFSRSSSVSSESSIEKGEDHCAHDHCDDDECEDESHEKCLVPTCSHKTQRLPHFTGHSTRQRTGPSCDLCQLKKIKCDAFIEVKTLVSDLPQRLAASSVPDVAKQVCDNELVNEYLTNDEVKEGYKLILSNRKLIKFRDCSHCLRKNTTATFSRGFTKEDVLKYEEIRGRSRKRKAYRRRRSAK